MSPTASPAGLSFIEAEEGRVYFIYDDAKYPPRKYVKGTTIAGNLTGGTGHLISLHSKIVDQAAYDAYLGKAIPGDTIDKWLAVDSAIAATQVDTSIKVPLSVQQRDALISLAYNIGAGAFAGSGVVRAVNAKNWNGVAAEFNKWTKTTVVKSGVKQKITSAGLVKRRADEVAYFFGGQAPTAEGKNLPVATEIGTPESKGWGPTEILGAGGTVATVAGAGFTTEGFLSYVFGGILIVAVIVFGAIGVKRYFFPS